MIIHDQERSKCNCRGGDDEDIRAYYITDCNFCRSINDPPIAATVLIPSELRSTNTAKKMAEKHRGFDDDFDSPDPAELLKFAKIKKDARITDSTYIHANTINVNNFYHSGLPQNPYSVFGHPFQPSAATNTFALNHSFPYSVLPSFFPFRLLWSSVLSFEGQPQPKKFNTPLQVVMPGGAKVYLTHKVMPQASDRSHLAITTEQDDYDSYSSDENYSDDK